MSINLTDEIDVKTKKGKLGSAKQIFLEGDMQTVEKEIQDINSRHNTLNTKHESLSRTVQGIAATGGASTATNVTYNNDNSRLNAENAQDAIDELQGSKIDKTSILQESGEAEDKVISQKAVKTELDKKIDKASIAQEFGDSENKVVSQFALPFREIESPEFINAIVDAEDHFLFGIKLDGSIEWSKGIPTPIRTKLQEIINKCHNDKTDILEAINAAKEELSASITALQEGKVDKEEGKSLIEDEVKECFRVISNDEFLWAVVDSEDRVLFGIYKATGKPYYPLNDMYHVIQNEEFFALWLDTDNHVLLGIRRDGEIIGEIHAVNALKEVVSQLQSDLSSLQEKVGTIDTNLKELLDVFSLQENPEYMAVEKDAEGKVLSATYSDGSHYSHNLKSETIDDKVNKEQGKSLIDSDVAGAHSACERAEGRTEITIDAEDKILGYRDLEGTRHEHKISIKHLELSDDAAKEVNEAFKSAGIKMENPSDFSKDSYVELPIPRVAAQVKIYASKLPTTKQDDIEAEIEYNDKDGNYFRKPVILNSQGASSMSYIDNKTGERGNMSIDINDDSKIKFGDFPSQDSFHLKKYYIDVFRGQCIVAYWLMEQVYQTRPIGKRYPYEMNSKEYNPYSGEGKTSNDFYTGAKCHPDGFPVVVTWVNTQTKEEKKIGIYTWNLKKSKEVYFANKKNPKNIILDGVIGNDTLFGGKVDWTKFEIRNPKSLIDINGAKYDGDNPKELSDTDANSKKVKDYIIRLSGVKAALEESNTKETFENYFIVDAFIDYYIISQVIYHIDGFLKNWIWGTWNGMQWAPTLYDVDSIWGMFWNGTFMIKDSDIKGLLGTNAVLGLETLYAEEIKARYKELRDKNVFSVENITNLLKKWLDKIGYENIDNEIKLYPETPSYRSSNLNEGWEFVWYSSKENNYDAEKTYNAGETCIYFGCVFKAVKMLTNVPPLSSSYANAPHGYGCYNSIKRVSVWLTNRLAFLDTTYSYTNV